MRPHIAPNLLSPTFGDKEQRPERAEALARLKSVNAFSVRAYQVIELPRSPQDPPEGTLHLALGPRPRELVAPRQRLPGQGNRPGRRASPVRGLHVEEHLHRLAGQEFGRVTSVANIGAEDLTCRFRLPARWLRRS